MSTPARSPREDSNTPPRPVALVPIPANIPARLKDRPQWVLWRYAWKDKRWTKIPHQVNKHHASSTDSATWTTFAAVWTAYQAGGWDGIGYVLAAADGLTGIDVDHCATDGVLDAQGQHWVQHFRSYAELSPSGALRIFVHGTLAGLTGRKKGNSECYDSGRFLSVTGHQLTAAPATIEPRQAELQAFHALIWPPKPKRAAPRAPGVPVDLNDAALIAKAQAARNGARFARLWAGDLGDYGGDASDGDLALCDHLRFWTQADPARMDRLFRQSGLMRDKWDERRGGQTYGERTITKACESGAVYQPPVPSPTLESVPVNLSAAPHPEPGAVASAACSACPYTDRLAQLEAENAAQRTRIVKLEAANEHLRARMKDLHATHLETLDTLRDPRLKLAANTAVAVAKEVASQVSRGADDDGWVRVTLAPHPKCPGRSLAEQAGRSDRRVSADLDQFEKAGWLKRRYDCERARRVDPQTGEITTQTVTVLRVQIPGADAGAPALLTDLRAKYDERDRQNAEADTPPKKWGGARPRCPEHPHAALVERREVCCAQCGKVLEFRERPYHPGELEEGPIDQAERPDTWPELLPSTPASQVDGHAPKAATVADDMPPERGNHVNSLTTCPPRERPDLPPDALEDAPHLVVLQSGREPDEAPRRREWWEAPRRCQCGVGLPPGQVSCGNRLCQEAAAMAGGAE